MKTLHQSPTDPAFVQNPYPFYARARAAGPLIHWADYDLPCATTQAAVQQIFRDRRFGREMPADLAPPVPDHLAPFYAVEAHSMLELEPPRHTRLRGLVLRAFTSRRITALAPGIAALTHRLIDAFPSGPFDLLPAFCTRIPVLIIARLLGVPEAREGDLLRWSNAMVGMYQAGRTRTDEDRATAATLAFTAFLRSYIAERRQSPADDLITHLIAAEVAGDKLSTDELITTCILLLNAGHEATAHTMGNGIKALLEHGQQSATTPDRIASTVEEILRYDPPLHIFTRIAQCDVTTLGHDFKRGDQVQLLLASANRDNHMWNAPETFDPSREIKTNAAFGGGLHFCVGAPLARLELATALPILFARCPGLRLSEPPDYADIYHFLGLARLMVQT